MRLLQRLRNERGQTIIMFAAIFTVIFVMGAVAVDIGLWLSERRGAQTDADLPALAGARECMLELASNGAYSADPEGAVQSWHDLNNGGNSSITEINIEDVAGTCRCVDVHVRHESRRLFSSFLDWAVPDIGAHAKACTGGANAPDNAVPFEIEVPGPCFISGQPNFGSVCPLEGGAHYSNPRGMLDLEAAPDYCSQAGGSGDIDTLIEWGAPGRCWINGGSSCDPANNGPWYDCVAVQVGNPQKVINGTKARISREGACDVDGDGIDSLQESVNLLVDSSNPSDRVYEARDCEPGSPGLQISSRLITIVVLEHEPVPGNTGYPILAFAGFYLDGCANESKPVQSGADLTFNEKKCHVGNPGHQVVYGTFLNLTVAGSGIGPVDPSGSTFGVALVE